LCLEQPVASYDVRLGTAVRDDHRPGLVLGGSEPGRELRPTADEFVDGQLLRFAAPQRGVVGGHLVGETCCGP